MCEYCYTDEELTCLKDEDQGNIYFDFTMNCLGLQIDVEVGVS